MKKKLNLLDKFIFNIYFASISDLRFYFVQDNIGMGFRKFKACEEIKELALKNTDNEKLLSSVFDKYYSEKVIRGIEVRIAPKKKKDLVPKIKQLAKINDELYAYHLSQDKNTKKIQIGIIIHYIKEAEGKKPYECRHARLREKNGKMASNIISSCLTQKIDKGGTQTRDINIIGIKEHFSKKCDKNFDKLKEKVLIFYLTTHRRDCYNISINQNPTGSYE